MRILRLVVIIATICCVILLLTYWAVFSACGSKLLLNWGITLLERNLDADIRVGSTEGSLLSCLILRGVQGFFQKVHVGFVCENLELIISFRDVLHRGIVIKKFETPHVKIWGAPNTSWTNDLVDLPPYQCRVLSSFSLGVDDLQIGLLEWMPAASGPLSIKIASFTVNGNSEISAMRNISFAFVGCFKNSNFLTGDFTGIFNQVERKLNGKFKVFFVGSQFEIGICLYKGKNGLAVEMSFCDFHISLSSISRWLSPLWKDDYPLVFTGGITGSGTCMIVNSPNGVFATFNGFLNEVTLILTGFNLPIFVWNGSWRYFDGKVDFIDMGSEFLGFPASFSGSVKPKVNYRPKWNMVLCVPEIKLESLIASLPWALRYAYGIPEINGVGSLTARIDGETPGILVNYSSLVSLQKSQAATAALTLRYRLEENGDVHCDVCSLWQCDKSLVKPLSEITVGSQSIENLYFPPISFRVETHGNSFDHLETHILIADNDGHEAYLRGGYESGCWSDFVEEKSLQKVFLPQDLGLLALILPGW